MKGMVIIHEVVNKIRKFFCRDGMNSLRWYHIIITAMIEHDRNPQGQFSKVQIRAGSVPVREGSVFSRSVHFRRCKPSPSTAITDPTRIKSVFLQRMSLSLSIRRFSGPVKSSRIISGYFFLKIHLSCHNWYFRDHG